MVFFKIWPENIMKAVITFHALRFKLNGFNQTCISSKSIMQLTKTIFFILPSSLRKDCRKSAVGKSELLWQKKNTSWLNISESQYPARCASPNSIPPTSARFPRSGQPGPSRGSCPWPRENRPGGVIVKLYDLCNHHAVVLDRLLDSYIHLHHLTPSPLPSLCCVRSFPFSVDLESAP